MKKIMALALSVLMIMSMCVVSVSAENYAADPLPETGLIFYDDFESYADGSEARKSKGGIWANFGGYSLAEINGKKVYNSSLSSGYSFAYAQVPATINTGRLKITLDVLGGAMYSSRMAINDAGNIPTSYVSIWRSAGHSVLFSLANAGDGVGYLYASGDFTMAQTKIGGDNCFEIDLTTPNEVTVIVDYDKGTLEYFLNDRSVYTVNRGIAPWQAGGAGELDIISDNSKGEVFGLDEENNTYPSIYIDAIEVERLGVDMGEDYVPSTELTEAKVLMEHDFTGETALNEEEWRLLLWRMVF